MADPTVIVHKETYRVTGEGNSALFDDLIQHFIADLFQRVVERTPVDSGRLVANWNFSVGSPNLTADEKTTTKSEKIAELGVFAESLQHGGTIYMSNGQPYSYRVETGWSGQAPSGMVQVTILEADDILAAAKLKAGL